MDSKKMLWQVPGMEKPMVVETCKLPWTFDDEVFAAWSPDHDDVLFPVHKADLKEIPKKKVLRLKSAGYMIDDAIKRGWVEESENFRGDAYVVTPKDQLQVGWWFIHYHLKKVTRNFIESRGIPDNWVEEIEVEDI